MALLPANEEGFTMETRDVSPAHLLVKIESFSMLLKQGIWKYESREFDAGGYKWRLIIYPDGHKCENGDHISVYMSVAGAGSLSVGWEVNAIFSIFLYNQIKDNYLCFRGKPRRFHAVNSKCGISRLILKKIFTDPSNGYLVDDNCVFGAEVFVIKSQQVIDCVSVLNVTVPYKRRWKISKFSKLTGVWTSEEFYAGRYQWRVMLYPNGNQTGKDCSVSIYMESVDSKSFAPHEKVKANICFLIKNKLHHTHHSKNLSKWFTSSKNAFGFHEFIPMADMRDPGKGFVFDDCCFFETEISVQAVVRDVPK